MDWKQARDNTLATWYRIRESLDADDKVQLLTDINAVVDLCVKAEEEAGTEPSTKCGYCLAYQQFGGCRGIGGEISAAVVEDDRERLGQLVDRFIAQLENLEMPPTKDAVWGRA